MPVLPYRLPLKLMRLLLVSATDIDVLPAPSVEALSGSEGQFGIVFRTNFKGYLAAAKVCGREDIGLGGALLRVAVTAAVPYSEYVLSLFDVALIAQKNGGGTAIALIYPYMDSTLLTWCLPARRSLAPQEYRHIAWSMLMGIMHLHSHELVHSNLTPCSVLISGEGFGESADSFGDLCDYLGVAFTYAEKAQSLADTLRVCIADSKICVSGSAGYLYRACVTKAMFVFITTV